MARRSFPVVLLLLAMAACSGDDGGSDPGQPDATSRVPATLLGIPAVVPADATACPPTCR